MMRKINQKVTKLGAWLRDFSTNDIPGRAKNKNCYFGPATLHHAVHPERAVAEAWRISKPGGTAKRRRHHNRLRKSPKRADVCHHTAKELTNPLGGTLETVPVLGGFREAQSSLAVGASFGYG